LPAPTGSKRNNGGNGKAFQWWRRQRISQAKPDDNNNGASGNDRGKKKQRCTPESESEKLSDKILFCWRVYFHAFFMPRNVAAHLSPPAPSTLFARTPQIQDITSFFDG